MTGSCIAELFALPMLVSLVAAVPACAQTQSGPSFERTFPYAVDVVKRSLEQVGAYDGGRLPMIDGFVVPTTPELDRYERPYYQYRVALSAVDRGSTIVKVEARISAWYADLEPSHSRYGSLASNGRLETDLLDRLQDALGSKMSRPEAARPRVSVPASPLPAAETGSPLPGVPQSTPPSLPTVQLRDPGSTPQEQLDALRADRQSIREKTSATLAQIEALRSVDRKSGGARKLASIKHSGVGVMSRTNFGGPVLFRAQAEDEFEVVSLDAGWVQVRLSDSTTGYVQADELNLPAGVEKAAAVEVATPPPAPTFDPNLDFWVSREDVNVFSGDWARLKGKKVLFVYAQPRGLLSDVADDAKLAYAKRIFVSRFHSGMQSSLGVEGVVVVFLGSRAGVAAATVTDIRQWVEGGLGDEAFVNRCSLDPPAEFGRIHSN